MVAGHAVERGLLAFRDLLAVAVDAPAHREKRRRPAALPAPRCRPAHHDAAQRSLDGGLQGTLPANALKQHPVGLGEIADGVWSIHFCRVVLGRVDERDDIITT
jgi:hypothetical protein